MSERAGRRGTWIAIAIVTLGLAATIGVFAVRRRAAVQEFETHRYDIMVNAATTVWQTFAPTFVVRARRIMDAGLDPYSSFDRDPVGGLASLPRTAGPTFEECTFSLSCASPTAFVNDQRAPKDWTLYDVRVRYFLPGLFSIERPEAVITVAPGELSTEIAGAVRAMIEMKHCERVRLRRAP